MNISVAIITKSEKLDKQVLKSVDFADEIILVVDSPNKKSKTVGKLHTHYHPLNNDYASQRNYALKKASNGWVLFIDSDEFVGSELAREIQLLDAKTTYHGFMIKRVDVCFHQPLLHGETGQTKLLRLARKTSGRFVRPVHERWEIKGRVGELISPIYHKKDSFVSDFIGRMIQYARLDADILTIENKPYTIWRLLVYPKAKFVQNYFVRLGILDGTAGLFLAYLMSVQSLTVRIFQWAKSN